MGTINRADKTPIRVLLIDENSDFFRNVQDQIELNSHPFKMACKHIDKIADAAETLKEWNPNLVVLDYANSPMLSAQIVKGCHQREVPLILTGDFNTKEVQEAIEKIGALAYVVKSEDPEDPEEVVELFARAARDVAPVH